MKNLLLSLLLTVPASGAYASVLDDLSAAAAHTRTSAPALPEPGTPAPPETRASLELERVRRLLSFGGGIPAPDAAFMNEWFPRFLAEGDIGRKPGLFERLTVPRWFPKLSERNDWRVTGEACRKYNCIAWSVGITGSWQWPGTDPSFFDEYYLKYGYVPLTPGESTDRAEIAYWESAAGKPTHGCRRVAGEIWESKLGTSLRILHRLNELEGNYYGFVKKFYRRATAQELSALGLVPAIPDGNGADPCASGKKSGYDAPYDIGSPFSN